MSNLTKQDDQTVTLAQRLKAKRAINKNILLLDQSGSMACDLEPGHTKIDALKAIVKNLKCTMIAFANQAYVIKDPMTITAKGGTVMSSALRLAKTKGAERVIIITDGQCNWHDQEATLNEAVGLEVKVWYVGPDPKPDFLNKLASSGFATKEDLTKPAELTDKLQFLLESGNTTASNTIIL